jgi:flagellin-like hook-associated protein FlgL
MTISLNALGSTHVSQREFANSQSAIADAIERLSSGLRVSKSSDDASALGISEAIRTQIKGLDQGARNANDLISMVQTADTSVNQATDMLRRMRELATQARNGSLSLDQKRAMSAEILELRDGINQVAEQTVFNTKSLLKNSLESQRLLSASDRTWFQVGTELAPGLQVSGLEVGKANEGSYAISFGSPSTIENQKSRVTTTIDGSLDTDDTQAITIANSGTASSTITLSGVYEAGDAIRFTVKGDSPDRTLVQTYVVTAENLTENNDGLSSRVAGDSLAALTNIAAGMAAQYNLANAVQAGTDVDLDNKFSKPDALASGATVTFSGSYNGTPLTAVTVGGYVINRPNFSREIIPTQADITAGNRITVKVNDLAYQYIVGSDETTETVAEGIRSLLAKDYPHHATRAGSIVTVNSAADLGLAEISYQVRQADSTDTVQSISSYISNPGTSPTSSRTITIADNDVIAGRVFSLDVGNPGYLRTYSVVAGTSDTASTLAQKLATRMDDHYGSGASAVSVSGGVVTLGSATVTGMANLDLRVTETMAGELNPTVGPATGITSAVWGVGGRLDDGNYQLSYNGSSWSVDASPVAGATFNGSVLTTSPGNAVNVRYTGTPKKGDTIFFAIANGDPTSGLGINGSAATGVAGIYNVADNDKTPNSVSVSGSVGTSFTATYSGGVWSVSDGDSNAYFTDAGRTSNSLSLYKYLWNPLSSSWYYSSTITLGFNSSGNYPPVSGDQIVYSGSGSTAQYQRDGVQTMSFAVAGGLDIGDYVLEYNGSTTASNYTIKNRFGDAVTSATYSSGWLTLDSGDQVELVLSGTPQVGDKVYFTITGGNVITNRLIEGSNIGGRETSVSSQTRDRTDRVISIATSDIQVGRSVEISVRGKEYAVQVGADDTASTVATKLASLLAVDYPNTTSQNETTDLPAGTRVSVSGAQITLQEPAKLGLDQIDVSVRDISNPGLITVTANSDSGIAGRSQTIALGEVTVGGAKTYNFDQLGIQLTLENQRNATIDESLFAAYSPRASNIQVDSLNRSPMAQLGASARSGSDQYLTGFGDIRLAGANKNGGLVAQRFDQLAGVLDELQANTQAALSDENFAKVIDFSDLVLDEVAGFQTQLGVAQNRLEHAISSIQNNSLNLQASRSALVEADYGDEMSKLIRMQIGQQAATAMMAQANLLPEVILSLLQTQPA